MNIRRATMAALSTLTAGVLMVSCTSTGDEAESAIGAPGYTGSKDRTEYQQQLNSSKFSFDPHFSIVLRDGMLWIRKNPYGIGLCNNKHCGTVKKDGDKYRVSLPVGYNPPRYDTATPAPKDLLPISAITYWDNELHGTAAFTRHKDDESTRLPYALLPEDYPYMETGPTAYVSTGFILRDEDNGKYFLDPRAEIRKEPLGDRFGYSEDALIARRSDSNGFEVKLPKGYEADQSDVDMFIPLKVTFAKGELYKAR